MNVNKLLKLLTWILTWELWNLNILNIQSMVIKTNLMWPFCIRHHIDVHLDTLVAFVRTDAQKNLITHGLPLLCMATKNEFNCHRIDDWKFLVVIFDCQLSINTINFGHHPMILIALMVTKTHFQSKNFGCHPTI